MRSNDPPDGSCPESVFSRETGASPAINTEKIPAWSKKRKHEYTESDTGECILCLKSHPMIRFSKIQQKKSRKLKYKINKAKRDPNIVEKINEGITTEETIIKGIKVQHGPSCLDCTAKSRTCLTCSLCTKKMTLDKFAKNQRKAEENALCNDCMEDRNQEVDYFLDPDDGALSSSDEFSLYYTPKQQREPELSSIEPSALPLDFEFLAPLVINDVSQSIPPVPSYAFNSSNDQDKIHTRYENYACSEGSESSQSLRNATAISSHTNKSAPSMAESVDDSAKSDKFAGKKSIFDDSDEEEEIKPRGKLAQQKSAKYAGSNTRKSKHNSQTNEHVDNNPLFSNFNQHQLSRSQPGFIRQEPSNRNLRARVPRREPEFARPSLHNHQKSTYQSKTFQHQFDYSHPGTSSRHDFDHYSRAFRHQWVHELPDDFYRHKNNDKIIDVQQGQSSRLQPSNNLRDNPNDIYRNDQAYSNCLRDDEASRKNATSQRSDFQKPKKTDESDLISLLSDITSQDNFDFGDPVL